MVNNIYIYLSVIQPGFVNNSIKYPCGKSLGGSSAINGMVYMIGDYKIYDQWGELGNTGWSANDALKYFMKSENNSNITLSTKYHSDKGNLMVSESTFQTLLADAFIEAGQDLGYAETDLNGHDQTGFMRTQRTIGNGKRCSTAKAYLRPAYKRSNLHIIMNSHVTRILFAPNTTRAIGIQFNQNDQIHTVFVKKEVILSAGAINTPKLLMLSGIGPIKELNNFKIPLIKHLPVGEKLLDHTGFAGLIFQVNQTLIIKLDDVEFASIIDYATQNTGLLTQSYDHGTALLKTKYAKNNIADIQLFLPNKEFLVSTGEQLENLFNLKSYFYNSVIGSKLILIVQPFK